MSLEYIDPDSSDLEERYIRIGLNISRGILLVVYCEKDDGGIIRIISTRKATSMEREDYEKELRS